MTLRSQVELKALRRCVVEMVLQDIESGPKMSDPSRATKQTVVSACTGTVSTSHAVHTSTYQTPAGSRNTGSIELQNLSVEHLILCFVGRSLRRDCSKSSYFFRLAVTAGRTGSGMDVKMSDEESFFLLSIELACPCFESQS
jgi:hypothetical protein